MGVLLHVKTGTEHTLSARVLIGRSGSCLLRLHTGVVSGEHATLSWTGSSWEVRDLGSSNGTWLGERQLGRGERGGVGEGDDIGFGTRSDPWRLIDAGPPTAVARPVQGGPPVRAEGGVLALPSPEKPELVLLELSEGLWAIETDSAQRPAANLDVVSTAGDLWRLYLPIALPRTSQPESSADVPSADEVRLCFAVSRDEEFVELSVLSPAGKRQLKTRTFHYLLLTLARLRLSETDASPRERGWIYIDDLARKLGIDVGTVNVYLMRARRQLGMAGVPQATLVERRPGSRLRMGSIAVTIEAL